MPRAQFKFTSMKGYLSAVFVRFTLLSCAWNVYLALADDSNCEVSIENFQIGDLYQPAWEIHIRQNVQVSMVFILVL